MTSSNRLHTRTPRAYWLLFYLSAIVVIPSGGLEEVLARAPEAINESQASNINTGTDEPRTILRAESKRQPISDLSAGTNRSDKWDVQFAREVIRANGTVTVLLDSGRRIEVDLLAYLPKAHFKLIGVTLGDFRGVISENSSQTPIDGTLLVHAKQCDHIESIRLRLVEVTDEGLRNLGEVSNLSTLVLSRANLYGDGLKYLSSLRHLTDVSLERNQISDESLKHFVGGKIESLNLYGCPLSDDCIQHLSQLTTLKVVDLRGTRLSAAGVRELKRALPGCAFRVP